MEELLRWMMAIIEEEAASSRRKTLVKIFLLSVVMVFKTGCILVTVEMKMYIYVHMPIDFLLLLRPVPVCSLLRLLLAML